MFSKHLTRTLSTFLLAAILSTQILTPTRYRTVSDTVRYLFTTPTARAQTTHTTQLTYNVYGTLTKITYPDGTIIEYEYGGLGKIKKVKKNGAYIVTDISYGAAEEIISVSLSNGVITTYTYNPDQLYRLTNKKTTNGALTLQNIMYSYDPVGNIIGLTDTGIGTPKQATYTYDGLNRLTSATIKDTNTGATITETYTYSKMGRILSTSTRGTYQYTNTQHPYAVTQAGTITYSYDTNGNLISSTNTTTSETVTYAYDSQSRLTSFTDKSGTTKYYYGDGYARVQKVLPNGKSVTYLGELAEIDEQGKFTTYVFADSIRIATQDSTGTYYHINDHLGSANLLLDANGNVVQKIDYLPFGAERLNEKYASFEAKHTFTDQEKDKESGLLYYGARYYDPALGRFTQPDPVVVDTTRKEFAQTLANPQLQNPYSYVANNPLKFEDQQGETGESFLTKFFSSVGKGAKILGKVAGPVNVATTAWSLLKPISGGDDVDLAIAYGYSQCQAQNQCTETVQAGGNFYELAQRNEQYQSQEQHQTKLSDGVKAGVAGSLTGRREDNLYKYFINNTGKGWEQIRIEYDPLRDVKGAHITLTPNKGKAPDPIRFTSIDDLISKLPKSLKNDQKIMKTAEKVLKKAVEYAAKALK